MYRTPDDILLRPELERLAQQEAAKAEQHPGEEPRFRVSYTVDRLPPRGEKEKEEQAFWPYDLGHVTADMIRRHLPPPGPGTFVAICGPPPFVHYACRPALEKLGFPPETVFEF
jgi:cytochrome-b5 reductase